MVKENEYKIYVDNQRTLLIREKEETSLLKQSKKRLQAIQREIKSNNNWLINSK